jgi:hypothetical protein
VPLGKRGLMSQNLVEALPNQNDIFMLKIERENV